MVGGDGPLCLSDWIVRTSRRAIRPTRSRRATTYAEAVEFTRVPSSLISVYFIPSIFFVMLSSLGFFINPAATPARVALGVITILAVITNRNALDRELPSAKSTWLSSFLYVSLIFNLFAFVEQVLVNLGIALHAWVLQNRKRTADAQQAARKGLEGTYTDAGLLLERIVAWRLEIVPMFEVLDVDSNGMVSSKGSLMLRLPRRRCRLQGTRRVLPSPLRREEVHGQPHDALVKLTKLARRSHQAEGLPRAPDSMGSDAMRAAAGARSVCRRAHPAGDAGTGERWTKRNGRPSRTPFSRSSREPARGEDSRAADAAS